MTKARRLIVIGYSVPPEDHVVAGMLAETLRGRDVEVVIADPCTRSIKARLTRLGIALSVKECFDKKSCAEDFTSWYLDKQATTVV